VLGKKKVHDAFSNLCAVFLKKQFLFSYFTTYIYLSSQFTVQEKKSIFF